MQIKIGGMQGLFLCATFFISVYPGLHIAITIVQHACHRVPKRVLKMSTYRLQIFPVKYYYLQPLQPCEDQSIRGKLEKPICKHVLANFATFMGTRL